MNDRWKDIFIIITLGFLAVLSTITIVEFFLVKNLKFDETITIGFIGAILGGALSGAITLIGVNKTIKENRRNDTQEKHLIANYIFTELLPELTQINNKIKSINLKNVSTSIDEIKEQSEVLLNTAIYMKEESKKLDLYIHREVKTIEYNARNMYDYIKYLELNPGHTDQEIIRELMHYRNELAKSDNELFKIVNKLKHS